MKALKIASSVIGILLASIIIFFIVYYLMYSQEVIKSFEINSPNLETKVLIGSQGSDFKNTLVKKLTDKIGKKNIYIKVIDVTTLSDIKEEAWDAIILLNTIEWYKLQKDVRTFLDSAQMTDKIIMLATSGEGDMKQEECKIDTITSASKINIIDEKLKIILARLEQILSLRF
jgi:hypothetical protein